jgi:hypothetical protein
VSNVSNGSNANSNDLHQITAILAEMQQNNAAQKTQPTIDKVPFIMTPGVMATVIAAIVSGAVWTTMQFYEIKRDIKDMQTTPAKVATLEGSQSALKNQVDGVSTSLTRIETQMNNQNAVFTSKMEMFSTQITNLSGMISTLALDLKNKSTAPDSKMKN